MGQELCPPLSPSGRKQPPFGDYNNFVVVAPSRGFAKASRPRSLPPSGGYEPSVVPFGAQLLLPFGQNRRGQRTGGELLFATCLSGAIQRACTPSGFGQQSFVALKYGNVKQSFCPLLPHVALWATVPLPPPVGANLPLTGGELLASFPSD